MVINHTASFVYIKNVHSFAMQICIYLSKMLQQNIPVLGTRDSDRDGKLFTTIQPQPMTSAFMSFGAFVELGSLCQTACSLVCFMR